jgi:sterol desaturase/sphingolipid hydroxylase (fatty acid hydroxylase superfamily)
MSTMLIEWVASKILKKKVYNLPDTISSISSGMTNNIKSILNLSVVIISYQWMFEHFAIFQISSSWWVYVLAFLGIDFANYWTHRWNHEFNILWNRHIIHHSSEEYNLACALRQTISSVFQIYFFLYIPLAIIGIPPKVITILLPLHLFAQFWYHTKLIKNMGFLEKIIVTPSHHRVHHAINSIYIDKNYSNIFIFWDFMFGTFQKELESETPVYGVLKPARTWNPIYINFMHLIQLLKDAIRARNWKDKFRIWFMPTGWRPKDVEKLFPLDIISNPHEYKKYQTKKDSFLNIWSCFQLTIHLAMQFHIIYLINFIKSDAFNVAVLLSGYQMLVLYGIFFMFSIGSFTSLMDRSKFSLILEITKNSIGFFIIFYFQEVLNVFQGIYLPKIVVILYLIISQAITIFFFFKFQKRKIMPISL